MTTTADHRVEVPLTPEQRGVVHALHDADAPEDVIARELLGVVPTSDSGVVAALFAKTLDDIRARARRLRLDAAYEELAADMAADAEGRAVDAHLATSSLAHAVDDGEE